MKRRVRNGENVMELSPGLKKKIPKWPKVRFLLFLKFCHYFLLEINQNKQIYGILFFCVDLMSGKLLFPNEIFVFKMLRGSTCSISPKCYQPIKFQHYLISDIY